MEHNQLVPETCLHAMETCPSVRTARATFLQHLNIAVMPIVKLSGNSILWTKHGKVLGPNQTQTTKSFHLNAVNWLASIEILTSTRVVHRCVHANQENMNLQKFKTGFRKYG